MHVFAQPDVDWAIFWLFHVPFMLVFCGLFISTAIFIFRRQYRHLCTLVSALVAFVVFGLLITLPEQFGLHQFLDNLSADSPWMILIGLPVSFAALFIPFYAARWAYRRGHAILLRLIHEDTRTS